MGFADDSRKTYKSNSSFLGFRKKLKNNPYNQESAKRTGRANYKELLKYNEDRRSKARFLQVFIGLFLVIVITGLILYLYYKGSLQNIL